MHTLNMTIHDKLSSMLLEMGPFNYSIFGNTYISVVF